MARFFVFVCPPHKLNLYFHRDLDVGGCEAPVRIKEVVGEGRGGGK